MSNLPILILSYNRPDHLAELIKSLKKVKPSKIYFSSDGPKNRQDEVKVNQCRELMRQLPWKCIVETKLNKRNLGCQKGVYTALDWFFENNEMGIILEDDCLANNSFFNYCKNLLEKYRADHRIGMISGNNFHQELSGSSSYFFSSHSFIWGWATWRDRWQDFHFVRKNGLKLLTEPNNLNNLQALASQNRVNAIVKTLEGKIDSWGYIWYLTNFLNNRLCIVPKYNLVSNAGFGKGATHTKLKTSQASMKTRSLGKNLKHPQTFLPSQIFDKQVKKSNQKHMILIDVLRHNFLKWLN